MDPGAAIRRPLRAALGFDRTRAPASWLTVLAGIAAALIALPVIGILLSLLEPIGPSWPSLRDTLLGPMLITTALLAVGTGIGVVIIGVSCAWLVTMCRFPGSRIFEWALILPLAAPAYVLAYVYTDFLQHPGAVQTTLRALTGWGPRDYWFPEIRSLEGAILLFSLVFYPYVYLLARTAFLTQSVCVMEASRSLGCTPWQSFWKVALPLARPAIVAGVALALMETLADFGAVAHFGLKTFTTGIYQVWFAMGDRILAVQLASGLLVFFFLLFAIERLNRGAVRYDDTRAQFNRLHPYRLKGMASIAAMTACALPVILGFVLPVILLLYLHQTAGHDMGSTRYIRLTLNSMTLAAIAAGIAALLALIIAYSGRLRPGRVSGWIRRMAGLGYALPGTVIAVGVLVPLARFDNALDGFMRETFDLSTGLLLTGGIAALIYAYLVRFMSISLGTVDAALHRVTPNMDAAARSLGAGPFSALKRVHVALVSGGLLTALLIIFVEVMKELPATLIMRPFNFDTLAIQAYRLASDERLAEASTASLMIVAAGLIPVILLSRSIARSRPGQ